LSFSHPAGRRSSPDSDMPGSDTLGDADISSLLDMLASIPDPRKSRGRQYAIGFILAVCVVATLAGAKNYREIASQAKDIPQPLLKKMGAKWCWFRLRYTYPAKTTIRNVLTKIDAATLDAVTCAWIFSQAVRSSLESDWEIAVDGKVLRGAWTDENDMVTMFSAMIHEPAVTVAQIRVPDDTNEITQAAAILDAMEIPDGNSVLLTLDAAHAQTETAEIFGGRQDVDYLVKLKGNQPTLQRDVFDKLLPLLSHAPHDIIQEHARGLVKKWSCWVTDAQGIDFPHIAQCSFIRRESFEVSGDRVSKEHALVITSRSTDEMTAAELNRNVRNHWGIENKSHYVRDTTYLEDHGQAWTGEGPQALASLRNLSISLLRLKGVKTIKETIQEINRDRMRAVRYMTT
jgi:predicted transposase YbfD/YdcC